MGTIKQEIVGDSSKLRAELGKAAQAEKALVAVVQTLTKESEKSEKAALKEAEARKKAVEAAKESASAAAKLTRENERQGKEIERLKEKIDKTGKAQKGLTDAAISGATSMVMQYVGVQQVLNHVAAAMERTQQLAEKSLTTTERVARAQSQVVFNMPGASQQQVTGVDQRIRAAADRARVSLPAFYETVAATSAATGGDIEAAIRGASAAAPLSRLDPTGMPVVSSAAAEIARATGLGEEQSLGLMMQYGGVARQTNTQQIAMALPEAIAAGAGASSNRAVGAEWAMERMAALSVETGDREGRRSATAIANLAVRMERFFGERPSLGVQADPYARESYLRDNPELAREFMAGLGGEITSYIPIREMFRSGSGMHGRVIGTEAAIDASGALGMYQRTVEAATTGTAELELANQMAATQALAETASLGGGDRAFARQQLQTAINAAMPGPVDYLWNGYSRGLVYDVGVEMGQDPYSTAATEVQSILAGERSQLRGSPNDANQQRVVETLEQILQTLQRGQSGSTIQTDRN